MVSTFLLTKQHTLYWQSVVIYYLLVMLQTFQQMKLQRGRTIYMVSRLLNLTSNYILLSENLLHFRPNLLYSNFVDTHTSLKIYEYFSFCEICFYYIPSLNSYLQTAFSLRKSHQKLLKTSQNFQEVLLDKPMQVCLAIHSNSLSWNGNKYYLLVLLHNG